MPTPQIGRRSRTDAVVRDGADSALLERPLRLIVQRLEQIG